jgi:putative Holliday junction resolvase
MANLSNTLGLDIGSRRIGVAITTKDLAVARPLETIEVKDSILDDINKLCQQHNIAQIVVGLPRNLGGEDTDQTRAVRAFAKDLENYLKLPIIFQDEALTSVTANESLTKSHKSFKKDHVDAVAAALILNDYLEGLGR